MPFDCNLQEKKIIEEQFSDSKNIEQRGDVIFVYPNEFSGDSYLTANYLQETIEYLNYLTNLNPSHFFNSRIIVGYTKLATDPNWSGRNGNRIQMPLKNEYLKETELLHVCAHELVHPFYRLSPLHYKNEKWGEPFCEFRRFLVWKVPSRE